MLEIHDVAQFLTAGVALVIALSAWLKRTGATDNELAVLKRDLEAHQVMSNKRHDEIALQLNNARLTMAEQYVTKADLAAMEARIVGHINMAMGCPAGVPTKNRRRPRNGEENGD